MKVKISDREQILKAVMGKSAGDFGFRIEKTIDDYLDDAKILLHSKMGDMVLWSDIVNTALAMVILDKSKDFLSNHIVDKDGYLLVKIVDGGYVPA